MSSSDLNYLCTRDGRVVGPLAKGQIDEMRRSGAIHDYLWIWEAGTPTWMPASPPPPPPSPIEAQSPADQAAQPARSYARFEPSSEKSDETSSRSRSEVTGSEIYIPAASFDDNDTLDSI